MRRSLITVRKQDGKDLRAAHRFHGTLSDVDHSMPCRFKTRIQADGKIQLDIHAFRVTKENWWIYEAWHAERSKAHNFMLCGITADGLRFESSSLTFTSASGRAESMVATG